MDEITVRMALEILGTIGATLWTIWQGSKLRERAKSGRFAQLEAEAELAVHQTAVQVGEDLKRRSEDGKLSKEDINTLRARARERFQSLVSQRGADVMQTLGRHAVDLLVEKAFARLKSSGVIMAVLLCVGLMAGCVTSVTTGPDGTVTKVTEPSPWVQDAIQQGAPYVIALIERELDDTPKPLTEEQKIELANNAALRRAVLEEILAERRYRREHPGETRVVDVEKVKASCEQQDAATP